MSEQIKGELTITDKMPAWMQQYLTNRGIAKTFQLEKLTKKQTTDLTLAIEMAQMEKEGLVTIFYDPVTCPEPEVSLTEKGVEAAKALDENKATTGAEQP